MDNKISTLDNIARLRNKLKELEKGKIVIEDKIKMLRMKLIPLLDTVKSWEKDGIFYCTECHTVHKQADLKPKIKKESVATRLIQGSREDGIWKRTEKIFLRYYCPCCKKEIKVLS